MTDSKLNIQDYVIYGIIFLLPYFEVGPWNWMDDIPFIGAAGPAFVSSILAIYIAIYTLRHHLPVRFKHLNILIWIATIYSLIELERTIEQTGFTEALTIYRKNYIYLPTFALIMTYISNMSLERIKSLGYLILISCVPITLIYFLQCSGINIFSDTILKERYGGIMVERNILGFPPVVPVIISFSFAYMLFNYNRKFLAFTVLLLAACFISYTRNLLITAVIAMVLSAILYSFKLGIKSHIKLVISSLLLFGAVLIIAPNSLSFWNNLLDSTVNVQLEKGIGSYAFRQKLIEHTIHNITYSDALLTGFGYIRDVAKGEYSLVLGSDTFVAPILWCEGLIGLILRCLPILYLLWKSISVYHKYNDESCVLFSIVIISSIVSQIPNYVQTSIFVNYCYIFAQLFVMYVFINQHINQKECEDA